MISDRPLQFSRLLLATMGTQLYTHYGDRVPRHSPLLIVSNHRSFMDAPLLMAATGRPIRFACHRYMSQVPVMRDIVQGLGCFPLEIPDQRQHSFFRQAIQLLKGGQAVGVFPEGTAPMVKTTLAAEMGAFQRGFAHLALRAPVADLAVLPIAIAPVAESTTTAVPLQLLSLFDPSEPLFHQGGWHPMVTYQRVNLLIGKPQWVGSSQQQEYQGKGARSRVNELAAQCRAEIADLLQAGLV